MYKKLFALKHENPALWNGNWGGKMIPVPNDKPKAIFSFVREKDGNKIFTVLNFSDQAQTVSFNENIQVDSYKDAFTNKKISVKANSKMKIPAYGYKVLVSK